MVGVFRGKSAISHEPTGIEKKKRKENEDEGWKREKNEYSQSLEAESSSHGRRKVVWESEIEVGSGDLLDFLRLRRIRIPSCINRHLILVFLLEAETAWSNHLCYA